MSPKQQEEPSKIIMLAPMVFVLLVYSFAFYSPQQAELQRVQEDFTRLFDTQHDTEHEITDTRLESSRSRKELGKVKSQLKELENEREVLLAKRDQMRRQLDFPSRPAATMQRVTSLMESHRLQVIESQPESSAASRIKEVVKPVMDLLADSSSKAKTASSGGKDAREIYKLKVRGRFHDLQSALEVLSEQLEHVMPLSLQMEPLELQSTEARQSQRIWTLTILV